MVSLSGCINPSPFCGSRRERDLCKYGASGCSKASDARYGSRCQSLCSCEQGNNDLSADCKNGSWIALSGLTHWPQETRWTPTWGVAPGWWLTRPFGAHAWTGNLATAFTGALPQAVVDAPLWGSYLAPPREPCCRPVRARTPRTTGAHERQRNLLTSLLKAKRQRIARRGTGDAGWA